MDSFNAVQLIVVLIAVLCTLRTCKVILDELRRPNQKEVEDDDIE